MQYTLRRLVDAAIMFALLSGNANFHDFALALVGFMILCALLAPCVVDEKSVDKIYSRSPTRKWVSHAVGAGYLGSLIFSGHPIMAAVYALSWTWLIIAVRRLRAA